MTAPTQSVTAAHGAILVIGMRWIDRAVGLLSTLVLARLLTPDDFGLIAISSLVIGFVDVVLDLGVNVALIRNGDATQEHYNTAWTMRLLQTTTCSVVVALAAPIGAHYFSEPRLLYLLPIAALSLPLAGLENIGIIKFQKEMAFNRDFQFMVTKRIATFTITITAAFLLRNYWALVLGSLLGRAFGTVLSYRIHSMRPTFSLARWREIFSVSQWMLVHSIGNYLENNLHRMFVGARETAAVMGGYALAADISAMPTSELLAPMNRVLFPRFVRAAQDRDELKRLFFLSQGIQALIAIPASIGLALVATEAVPIFLGEKWRFAVPFVQILALASAVRAITSSGGYVLITVDRIRGAAALTWLHALLLLALVTTIANDPEEIAAARLASVGLGLAAAMFLVIRELPSASVLDVLQSTWRPVAGGACMTIVLLTISTSMSGPEYGLLATKVVAGAATYCATVWLLWRIAGSPAGAEAYLIDFVLARHRRAGSNKATRGA